MAEKLLLSKESHSRLDVDLLTWGDLAARAAVILNRCGYALSVTGHTRVATVDKAWPAFLPAERYSGARIRLSGNPGELSAVKYNICYQPLDEADAGCSLFLGLGRGAREPAIFAYTVWNDYLGQPVAARPASQLEAEAVCSDLETVLGSLGAVIELPDCVPGCDGGILRI